MKNSISPLINLGVLGRRRKPSLRTAISCLGFLFSTNQVNHQVQPPARKVFIFAFEHFWGDSQASCVFFFRSVGSKLRMFFFADTSKCLWHSKWPPKVMPRRDSMLDRSFTYETGKLAKQPEFHLEMWQHGKVFCLKTQHHCVAGSLSKTEFLKQMASVWRSSKKGSN